MAPATKAELLSALANTDVQIKLTAARIMGIIDDKDWRKSLDHIVELRKVREDLESRLAALN